MSLLLRSCVAFAALFAGSLAVSQDKKEQAENPYYKFWSKSKVGATVSLKETTKVSAPSGAEGDSGEEVKLITHKLVELTAEKAVVETVVTEGEIFGFVQSAPTRHIYPAKMSKELLDELLKETGAKGEKAKLKVGEKEMDVTYLSGSTKKGKDDEVEFKIWLSEEVPGGIVKRVRTSKFKGATVAETTIELASFNK
jgi:hypothetical protein